MIPHGHEAPPAFWKTSSCSAVVRQPVLQELLLYGQNARPLKNEPVAHVLYALPGGREILLSEQETDEAGRLSLSLLSPGSYTLRIQNRRLKLEAQGGGQIQSVYL